MKHISSEKRRFSRPRATLGAARLLTSFFSLDAFITLWIILSLKDESPETILTIVNHADFLSILTLAVIFLLISLDFYNSLSNDPFEFGSFTDMGCPLKDLHIGDTSGFLKQFDGSILEVTPSLWYLQYIENIHRHFSYMADEA